MIELKPHQKLPIKFMKTNRALLLFHSVGSGKTLTALYAMYQFDLDIIIVGDKGSKNTFVENIKKANLNFDRFNFYTYSKIKKLVEDDVTFFKNKSVILDEAHRIRTENMRNMYLSSALLLASKIMLLTATPVINYLNDLSVLINIVRGEDVLPTEKKLFDQLFYDDENKTIINSSILFSRLKNTLSYYMAPISEDYPIFHTHYIQIEMNHEQVDEYAYYIRKIIYEGDTTINSADILNINYGLLPNKKKNFFLNVTRQLSNTLLNQDPSAPSPKILAIYNKITEGPSPSIVYSNFLRKGIYALAILLEKNHIQYKSITGNTTPDKLKNIVESYNKGLYTVLLISSAGSESLDLKNTRQIHLMELHWNQARIQQVIGRAIRYKSHSLLTPKHRVVDIYYWISIFPSGIKNETADQYLMRLSKLKSNLWDKYQKIIISASIENNFSGGSYKQKYF